VRRGVGESDSAPRAHGARARTSTVVAVIVAYAIAIALICSVLFRWSALGVVADATDPADVRRGAADRGACVLARIELDR